VTEQFAEQVAKQETMATTKQASASSSNAKPPTNGSAPSKPPICEQDVRKESSKAANAASRALKKAKELRQAAAGAGDPDERQKLTEQAVNSEIEAESFGKTAKYLRSGAFQGAAVGTGIGVAPSATLGALTGTLVGGVTSVITGGLGCGIGAVAGAVNGPMVDMGKMAGKGVNSVAGSFLPSWAASKEQKQALEKMVGQVNEQEMPDEGELEKLKGEGGGEGMDEGWMESAKGMMPSMKSGGKVKDGGEQDSKPSSTQKTQKSGTAESAKGADTGGRKKPRKLESKRSGSAAGNKDSDTSARKKPRKLETKSDGGNGGSNKTNGARSQPRKLEARSS
jgi:hypothetical protein